METKECSLHFQDLVLSKIEDVNEFNLSLQDLILHRLNHFLHGNDVRSAAQCCDDVLLGIFTATVLWHFLAPTAKSFGSSISFFIYIYRNSRPLWVNSRLEPSKTLGSVVWKTSKHASPVLRTKGNFVGAHGFFYISFLGIFWVFRFIYLEVSGWRGLVGFRYPKSTPGSDFVRLWNDSSRTEGPLRCGSLWDQGVCLNSLPLWV